MNGGRFDFDDGGTFCGGWEEGKAHGHGVCTGPDSQGEYAGAWHYGFEVSGIYTWPSGSTYSGQWQNGKRHGLGVEHRGRWIYKGEWSHGYKGRYGQKEAINSNAHYLGTWSVGLHDGYGTEVYADGGSYKGQWLRGLRHGYGIRTSATFENASKHRSRSNTRGSLTSLRSNYDEDGVGDAAGNRSARDKKSNERHEMRGGFVLKSKSIAPTRRRRSLSERSLAVKRTLLNNLRIKKQHSTGDIHQRVTSKGGSLRSSNSTISCTSDESDHKHVNNYDESQEEKIDPGTIEVYKGEWKNDVRSGFGICERSDNLRYVGEWLDNKKHGYGVTYFKDGTKEEGRYKNNILVCSIRRKGIFFVRNAKLRERLESSIENARRSAEIAAQRVEIALSRTMTAQERSDASIEASERAKDDADTARIYCAQFDPNFRQPGIDHMRQNRSGNRNILQTSSYANHVSFESTTSSIYPSGYAHNQQSHIFLQKHHGIPPVPSSIQQQQQQAYQCYNQNQNQKTLNKSSNDNHLLQQKHQLNNLRIGEPQHQLDANNPVNDSRYNTIQKNFNISLNPEITSTSGSSIHYNELNNHNFNQQQSTTSITKQDSNLCNLQTNLQKNYDNIVYSNNINSNGSLRNQIQNQSLQTNSVMDTLSGASTSKISTNLIGKYDTIQQNRLIDHSTDCISTMSLSDDHFDQYTLKKIATSNERKTTLFDESVESRLRCNRASSTRQKNINRRCTLSSSRDQKDPKLESYFLHHNYINNCKTIENNLITDNVECGSLPNLTKLNKQEIYLKREEASRLASERRREAQRLIEEEERLHSNPLRYIYHPVVKNWFKKWRVSILLIVGNIILLYYLMYLLKLEKKAKSETM